MGAGQSIGSRKLSEVVVEESRADAFSLWPGLDYHLDLSFNSLDTTEQGVLTYEELEPLLRHHLMQIGLIEYLARFATPEGQLRQAEVSEYLSEYGVDVRKPLTKKDWKNLMLAWIRRVSEAQAADIESWRNDLREMQKEQSKKYQNAMRQFQKHYIEQLENFYKSVEDAHTKEESYRQEWETSLGLQEEFYASQMEYLQEKNAAAEAYLTEQMEAKKEFESDIMKHIKTGREYLPGNISSTTFAYPTSVTTTGAPVSGGAQLPTRRPLKRGAKPVCC